MRKVLFTVLGLNLLLEGLTSARLMMLPLRREDFDAMTHGGFVLYGFAAFAAAASIRQGRSYTAGPNLPSFSP